MNDILLTAMAALLSKMAKSAGPLDPGSYVVDETVTLRLCGTVDKGDDEIYTPTVDIPLLAVLALFIDGLRGRVQTIQVETIMEILTDAMVAAIAADVKGDKEIAARIRDINTAMERVREMTAALPQKTRTGKTRVDATLVTVPAPVAATVAP